MKRTRKQQPKPAICSSFALESKSFAYPKSCANRYVAPERKSVFGLSRCPQHSCYSVRRSSIPSARRTLNVLDGGGPTVREKLKMQAIGRLVASFRRCTIPTRKPDKSESLLPSSNAGTTAKGPRTEIGIQATGSERELERLPAQIVRTATVWGEKRRSADCAKISLELELSDDSGDISRPRKPNEEDEYLNAAADASFRPMRSLLTLRNVCYHPYTRRQRVQSSSSPSPYDADEKAGKCSFDSRIESIAMEKKAYSEKRAAYERQLVRKHMGTLASKTEQASTPAPVQVEKKSLAGGSELDSLSMGEEEPRLRPVMFVETKSKGRRVRIRLRPRNVAGKPKIRVLY